jgi:hypothetical protein
LQWGNRRGQKRDAYGIGWGGHGTPERELYSNLKLLYGNLLKTKRLRRKNGVSGRCAATARLLYGNLLKTNEEQFFLSGSRLAAGREPVPFALAAVKDHDRCAATIMCAVNILVPY